MLALGANASAAPISVISKGVMARTPVQVAGDCIRYSDCQYRWLRCGNGWCRGPLDPFGGGSAPKIEMHCTTTVEPCGPEHLEGTAGGSSGGGRAERLRERLNKAEAGVRPEFYSKAAAIFTPPLLSASIRRRQNGAGRHSRCAGCRANLNRRAVRLPGKTEKSA